MRLTFLCATVVLCQQNHIVNPMKSRFALAELSGGLGQEATRFVHSGEPNHATESGTAPCSPGQEDIFEEKLLAEVPGEYPLLKWSFSPDLRRVIWCGIQRDKFCVYFNERLGVLKYEGVWFLGFSPDSKSVVYVASFLEGRETRMGVAVNSFIWKSYDEVLVHAKQRYSTSSASGFFSGNSKRVAYAARKARDWYIVVDGEEGEPFEEVTAPVFDPVGDSFAYYARRGTKSFVVSKDRKLEDFDDVGEPTLSVDGTPLGFRYRKGPVFTPDGTKLAYPARDGTASFMIMGNQRSEQFYTVGLPVFSSDGARFAYKASKIGKPLPFIVLGTKKIKSTMKVSFDTFSPDCKRVVYRLETPTHHFHMHVDDQEWRSLDFVETANVSLLSFSPDSKRFAFAGKDVLGRWFVVIDDRKGEAFDNLSAPQFTHDGKHVIYAAKKGNRWYLMVDQTQLDVLDDQADENYDRTTHVASHHYLLSNDSKKVAYGAVRGQQLYRKVKVID